MRHAQRRYHREFIPAMAAYVVVLCLSLWALQYAEGTLLRALVAIAPAGPVILCGRAVVRFVRGCDELDRKILLEAFSLAALVVTLGTFSLGLLGTAGVVAIRADLALIWILPAYCGLYGLFACIARLKYR